MSIDWRVAAALDGRATKVAKHQQPHRGGLIAPTPGRTKTYVELQAFDLNGRILRSTIGAMPTSSRNRLMFDVVRGLNRADPQGRSGGRLMASE